MVEFEESGGLLDGILAVAHPELYAAAQDLMTKLSTVHAPSTFLMQTWPSSFTSIQVIANRQTPFHRVMSSKPGWLDLLLSLGDYGDDAVLEVRSLGISFPYGSGTVVPLSSKLLLHGVPRVNLDRVCYALYLNKAVFEWMNIPLPGMATGAPSASPPTQPKTALPVNEMERRGGGSASKEHSGGREEMTSDDSEDDASMADGGGGGEIEEQHASEAGGDSVGNMEGSGSDESGGAGDAEGSSSGEPN